MDSFFKLPTSPGTPLFPVSPERVNRQLLPQAPSLTSNPRSQNDPFTSGHSRTLSTDVQGKVAQFNNLAKEDIQKRKDNEAALRRAVLGREEAENETKRFREENRILRNEIEEGRARERKIGERLEGMREEIQRSKETKAVYQKDVRRARKDAFKSHSDVVKLQEELKSTRNKFTLVQDEVELQRRMVERREQEAFAAEFRIVGVQEELEKVRLQIRSIEEEREILKTRLEVEELAMTDAEGKRPASKAKESTGPLSPKRGRRMSRGSGSFRENVDPELTHLRKLGLKLRERLEFETTLRKKTQTTLDFMKMECQFKCCPCRRAEANGGRYIHYQGNTKGKAPVAGNLKAGPEYAQLDIPSHTKEEDRQAPEEQEPLINFSPSTGTFFTIPAPPRQDPFLPMRSPPRDILTTTPRPQSSPQRSHAPQPFQLPPHSPTIPLDLECLTLQFPSIPPSSGPAQQPIRPTTAPPSHPNPRPQTHRIISTTRTIPLLPTTPVRPTNSGYEAAYSPNATMSRQEALDSIRERRGRARSFATPKKEVRERRDLSAPARRG